MQDNKKGSTTAMKAVCATLFFLFVVNYIYFFQCDVLAMTQYAWSGGMKHYDRIVGTVVITSIMTVLTFVVCLFTRIPNRFFTLNFAPTLVLLGMMTAVGVRGTDVYASASGLFLGATMLLISIVLLSMLASYKAYLQPLRAHGLFSHPWWTNLSLLFVLFCIVYAIGNTDRTLHTRLAVERQCKERNYSGALSEGIPKYDNDSSLVMLRAMALANTVGNDSMCMLGEKLFCYEMTGNSESLFPRSDKSVAFLMNNGYNLWQTIGFVPRDQKKSVIDILRRQLELEKARQIALQDTTISKERRDSLSKPLCKPTAADYLLCGYLLDKNLKEFVKVLPRYYKIDNKMPQHYREACILYSKKMNNPLYTDTAMEADYEDFLNLMRTNRNVVVRKSTLRDGYFGTYWYYYYSPFSLANVVATK